MPGKIALNIEWDIDESTELLAPLDQIRARASDGEECLSDLALEYFRSGILPSSLGRENDPELKINSNETWEAAIKWQEELWRVATSLQCTGYPDRLIERYWSITHGKGHRRPDEDSVLKDRQNLERIRDDIIQRWTNGEIGLTPEFTDAFEKIFEQPIGEVVSEGFRREEETVRLALVYEYLSETELWSTIAAERARHLIELSRLSRIPRSLGTHLTRIARLYIDGHDASVCIVVRAALESALSNVFSDNVVMADFDVPPEYLSLALRIEHALKRGRLRKRDADTAHRIRIRGNDYLHGDASDRDEALNARQSITDLFEVLYQLESK